MGSGERRTRPRSSSFLTTSDRRDSDPLALASELADELTSASAVLLAVPLDDYGVSQHLKAWVDLVIAGSTPGTRLLEGVPTVLATVRGGNDSAGTPREGWDHSTGYLRRILAEVWGADLTVVERDFTLVGVNPALDAFTEQAQVLHTEALSVAREAGRALGAVPWPEPVDPRTGVAADACT